MSIKKEKIIVILGPTASGKSDLAVKIATQFNGEIISSDSRQIYKELNIGSNKITKKEQKNIKHYLLNIIKPNEEYNLFNWQQDTFKIINKLHKQNKIPIIAGGTGLYISSILQNYKLSESKTSECLYDFIIFGINPNRIKLYKKIDNRVLEMIDEGLIKEVKKIYKKYKNKKLVSLTGIGYKEIISYLDNEINLEESIKLIQKNTRHYAKRQMTWFRKMEKEGLKINWNNKYNTIEKLIKKFLT